MNTTYSQYSPNPIYSLADLFTDIREGRTENLTYDGMEFTARRNGLIWEVEHPLTGLKATSKQYCNCMLDLQGMAACLIAEGRNLSFDRQGNFI